ncbi:MAG: hypothetical protein ACJ0BH_03975 [Candidatus Puniceispirillaceae bacterium]
MPCLTRPKVVFGFISRPMPVAAFNCSQTHPSPPGIFILDNGVGLVAKRIEIIPSTTPQMLCIFQKIWPLAVTSGGLMRYISSGAWYVLRVAYN